MSSTPPGKSELIAVDLPVIPRRLPRQRYRASEISSPVIRAEWFVLCSAGGMGLESRAPRLPGGQRY
jgi:hypothetical protein